ncbi:LacI family transcriptional regulator [Saccharobesus litoralis]|uniref:LacI family transcriptional regulator n=1 Tax=Saccharobesus litoralis TaxID=2172099 RepID=A0A2S0VSR8_9ALTE|nr:LacI family DNA-binding transcriptional regulator [Saccharobesus litoralis]AWB67233.1 LacI family transcriptional regulator [Saccharobesus litoralis]
MNKLKATSFDIAYRAGVSQSTVSRALRNSPQVNEETRKRIQAIAKELNYKVDKNASNLRTRHSGTIALLLFEELDDTESHINPFYLSMLGSITRTCSKEGYDLLVSFQQFSDDWSADYADTNKADGLILLGYGDYLDYEGKLNELVEQGTKFVRWGAVVEGEPWLSIGCDNKNGGYLITRHLLSLGRRTIAFIGGADNHSPELYERYKGYCKAIEEAGYYVDLGLQFDAVTTEIDGAKALERLLASEKKFDAIVCASDLIAIGVIGALQEKGFQVPEDIAVVGFDDLTVARYSKPALTTVQQNTNLAGQMLVYNLLKQIDEAEVETRHIPAKLIVRESCGSKL